MSEMLKYLFMYPCIFIEGERGREGGRERGREGGRERERDIHSELTIIVNVITYVGNI